MSLSPCRHNELDEINNKLRGQNVHSLDVEDYNQRSVYFMRSMLRKHCYYRIVVCHKVAKIERFSAKKSSEWNRQMK